MDYPSANPPLHLRFDGAQPLPPDKQHVGYHYAWADRVITLALLSDGQIEFTATRDLTEAEAKAHAAALLPTAGPVCVIDGRIRTYLLLSLQAYECLVHFNQFLVVDGPRPQPVPEYNPLYDPLPPEPPTSQPA